MKGPVAFLFLGETLLIPHLFPIVEALAARGGIAIDLWVSSSVHEQLLGGWIDWEHVRIRRAPGFREVRGFEQAGNPELPNKLLMLARLAPTLARAPVVVCAEQTSLWLPTLLPLRSRFVKTAHGAGSMSARSDRRRRSAALTMVPSAAERDGLVAHGVDPARIHVTGYVKASFRQRTPAAALFADNKPILLYAPHWQAHRSSWPAWGATIVEQLAAQRRHNVILAPHQRLAETAPELRRMLEPLAALPHIHCDLSSFAMVDGSYTAMADIYVGDTSSQVVEYWMKPRPAIFLNPWGEGWRNDPSFSQWRCGLVVDDPADLTAAVERAPGAQAIFAERQRRFCEAQLGDTGAAAPGRAAALIAGLLDA